MKKPILLAMLLAVLLAAPALTQEGSPGDEPVTGSSLPGNDGAGEPVTVTFELTVDGEVPEGELLSVDTGLQDVSQPVFCTTASFGSGDLPRCEDGETYSDTFKAPAGTPFSYEYTVFDYDSGAVTETFAADTRTFTKDASIRAVYRTGGDPDSTITTTGVLEEPEITTYMYGSHAITDEATGTLYALRSEVLDLDEYVGERVTLYGAPVPGYEEGQIEGGPPLVEVTDVRADEETVTVTFELNVEGEPPENATFFGYLGYEPAPFQLADSDGDGVYTGSTPSSLVPAGDTQPAWIVQGTGTRRDYATGTSPGEPSSILQDFGEVKFEEDTTLEASVSFDGGGNSEGESSDDTTGGIASLLPGTGGTVLVVLAAGVLLVAGGLLVRRIFR